MHKKLASDLNSLAHDILKMRDKDIFALKEKASKLYEKLSVLAYVEEYLNTTPQATETKEELISKIEKAEGFRAVPKDFSEEKFYLIEEETSVEVEEKIKAKEEKPIDKSFIEESANEVFLSVEPKNAISSIEVIGEEEILPKETLPEKIVKKVIEKPKVEIPVLKDPFEISEKEVSESKNPTLEEELQDTLSVDVMTELFTKVEPQKSLNDKLSGSTIELGLNDRIAFVNHLFNGDQSGFNRMINTLNSTETERKALEFIQKEIKSKYNWSEKEEYEARLYDIISRKFN